MYKLKMDVFFVYVVTEVFYPSLSGGARRLFRNGTLLRERGGQMVVFTEMGSQHNEDELEVDGIQIHRIRLAGKEKMQKREALVKAAMKFWIEQGRPEAVLHLAAVGEWGTTWELWKARVRGLPAVYGITIAPDAIGGGAFAKYRERFVTRVRFSPFVRILALSEETVRCYEKRLGRFGKRMAVIRNGVDTDRFSIASSIEKKMLRQRFFLSEEDEVVLFVGAIVPRKRVDLLIEIWGDVLAVRPNAKLFLVGSELNRATFVDKKMRIDYDNYSKAIADGIEALKREGSIRLIDATDEVEIYYKIADLFVLPSSQEGLPNVLLEAMASGLPAVISEFSGLPRDGEEIGIEGQHYYACVRDDVEWAGKIINALSDREKCRQIGGDARKLMEEYQAVDIIADRLVCFYKEIIGLIQD